jgi:hypothetical protein
MIRSPRHRRGVVGLIGVFASLAGIVFYGASASARLPAGDVEVGGSVPSFLGLSVTQPAGLGMFPSAAGSHSYTSSFDAAVTSTDVAAQLSVIDDGQRGRMTSGATALTLPLQVAASGRPFVSLAGRSDVVLKSWTGPIAGKMTQVQLLQRVDGAPPVSGPYRISLLITAASGTP